MGSRPVAASLLKELAPHLADIHGQHDQQLLFSAEAQRDMLDVFAGNKELLDRVAEVHRSWRAAAAELEELERSEQEKLRLLDLWSFQRKEIESAGLDPDEDAALENERRVLQNVQRLQAAASTAYEALYESPESALSLARIAAKRVEELCRIDSSLDGLARASESGRPEPAGGRLLAPRLPLGPGSESRTAGRDRDRLAAIDKLKRKYGQSIAEVLAFLEEVRQQIAAVEHAGRAHGAVARRAEEARRRSSRSWRRS